MTPVSVVHSLVTKAHTRSHKKWDFLLHGTNFGQMPFPVAPMTDTVTTGLEPWFVDKSSAS